MKGGRSAMRVIDFSRTAFLLVQRGFTLLEVLISIFVLSIGLLGAAALQIASLKASHSSYQVSIANFVAKDVRERLWAALLIRSDYVSQGDRVTCPAEPGDGDNRLDDVAGEAGSYWVDYEGGVLPEIALNIVWSEPCEYVVEVSWRDEWDDSADNGQHVVMHYYVRLPGYEYKIDPDDG